MTSAAVPPTLLEWDKVNQSQLTLSYLSLQIIEFHRGKVVAVGTFPYQHYFVTAGSDGSLIIWDIESKDPVNPILSHLMFKSSLTCLSCSRTANLIAVGSATGILRIIEAHSGRRPTLIAQKKLFHQPMTAVGFHPKVTLQHFTLTGQGKYIATAGERRVILLDTTEKFNIIGYVSFPGPITSLDWNIVESVRWKDLELG